MRVTSLRHGWVGVLVVGLAACGVQLEEELTVAEVAEAIDLASCGGAKVPCLPKPQSCDGPDPAGWSNKPRSPDAGPCPAPPSPANCKQYVIGRQKDVEKYINCPGFIVLNRDDYTSRPGLNDLFISCAACGGNGNCTPGILIASGDEDLPDWSKEGGPWASTELCQLNKYCTVTTQPGGQGSVTNCDCASMANDCGPPDAGPPDAGPPDAGPPDAGPPDAGPGDAGAPDAGPPDAGPRDAGTPDAGPRDAGTPDAGPRDAGTPDAGTPDAGPRDAGTPDAGTPDAGPRDAGTPDAGPRDAGTTVRARR